MSVNPNLDNPADKLYPALYEISTVYSDLAKTVIKSIGINEYADAETVTALGREALEVAEQALNKIEPGYVTIQWARKRLDPEGWHRKVQAVLSPPHLSVIEGSKAEGPFWPDHSLEIPRRPKGAMTERLFKTIGNFKGRQILNDDLAKVLYAEEYDEAPAYSKTKATSLLFGVLRESHVSVYSSRVSKAEEHGLAIKKVHIPTGGGKTTPGVVAFDIDSVPPEEEWLRGQRIANDELLSWAIRLRNDELAVQEAATPSQIDDMWAEREVSRQEFRERKQRKAERWFKKTERMDAALEYAIHSDAAEEIAAWKAVEDLWFKYEQEIIKLAGKRPVSSRLSTEQPPIIVNLRADSEENITPTINTRGLNYKETEIFDLLAYGLSNREISRRVGLTENGVNNRVDNIIRKVGANTRIDAAILAYRGMDGSEKIFEEYCARAPSLSPRELDILEAFPDYQTRVGLAEAMERQLSTLTSQIQTIHKKLGTVNKAQLNLVSYQLREDGAFERMRAAQQWSQYERQQTSIQLAERVKLDKLAKKEIRDWQKEETIYLQPDQEAIGGLIEIDRPAQPEQQLKSVKEIPKQTEQKRVFRGELDEDGYPIGFIEQIEALEIRLKKGPSDEELAEYSRTRNW